jgi:DNA repair protein RadD
MSTAEAWALDLPAPEPAALVLRPMQAATLDKVREAWRGGARNVLVQAPCGFGKTEIATAFLQATFDKGNRAAFVCDRLSLVQQTGDRFDKYGLKHGVIQGDHWRRREWERIQLCSIQTVGRRRWPKMDLLVADEAHVLSRTLKTKLTARDCRAIGLTATPFTRGLGKYFDALVNAATTYGLIEAGWLVPFRIFAASEPDMSGVRANQRGEFEEKETERRVLPIVGDCVAEYLRVGEGRKFIAFAVSVAHAEELQRQFMAAGVNVSLYTYQEPEQARKDAVEEFRKPDSFIRGLISIEALTRGFDVADVGVLILARPLRKSLAVHMQMIGRVLRTAEGKKDAIILDHASNCVRFWEDMQDYLQNGAAELDDGKPKERKAKSASEAKPQKCPKCHHVHRAQPFCPACGYTYSRRSNVEHVEGTLRELTGLPAGTGADARQELWSQLLWIARLKDRKRGWAEYRFKDRTGVFPSGFRDEIKAPSLQLLNWVKSQDIAYARAKAPLNGKPRR